MRLSKNVDIFSRQFLPSSWLWIISIVLTFSSVKYLPGMLVFSDAWAFLSLVFGFYVLIFRKEKLYSAELYFILMMIYLPFVSALASNQVFDQPFLYGFICQRQYFIIGFSIYFLNRIKCGFIKVADFENYFVFLSWLFLFSNTAAYILIDPTKLAPSDGFLDESDPRLLLDTSFIFFGFFYYGISGVLRGDRRHQFFAMLFYLYYFIVAGGRFGLISMSVAFVVCCFKWLSISRFILFFFTAVVLFSAFLLGILGFYPDLFQDLLNKFIEAYFVISTGEAGLDPSANSRLDQADIAERFLVESPFFGSGLLSAQWNDGFKGVLGYFHPSDNGFMGVVFVFGYIGLALILAQYIYAFNISKSIKLSDGSSGVFSKTIQCYLFFVLVNSFTTGRIAFCFEQTVFLITVLYACHVSGNRDIQLAQLRKI